MSLKNLHVIVNQKCSSTSRRVAFFKNYFRSIDFKNISASTAYHAIELGFRTILIEDCSRGIKDESIKQTFEKVKAEYGCVVNSSEVT